MLREGGIVFLHEEKQELHGMKSLLHDAKWEEKM